MRRVHGGVAAVLVLLAGAEVRAHGLAAAFVSIETSDGYQADVLVKLPRLEGATPGLSVRFAEGCEELSSAMRLQRTDGVVEGLVNPLYEAAGRDEDRAVGAEHRPWRSVRRVRSLDAPEWNTILRRGTATTRLGARERAGFENNASYFPLGVEHILSGFDHVFFVIGLLLIVWRTRAPEGGRSVANTILATITAFTIGHSVTLAAATLGLLKLPAAPTELAIALSSCSWQSSSPRTTALR